MHEDKICYVKGILNVDDIFLKNTKYTCASQKLEFCCSWSQLIVILSGLGLFGLYRSGGGT